MLNKTTMFPSLCSLSKDFSLFPFPAPFIVFFVCAHSSLRFLLLLPGLSPFLPERTRVAASPSHSQRPSTHPSSALPFFPPSAALLTLPSAPHLSFFIYLLKIRGQIIIIIKKRGEPVLCALSLSLCSAKRTQLFNPCSGFGTKGNLKPCKRLTPIWFHLSQSGSYFKQEEKKTGQGAKAERCRYNSFHQ